MDLMNLYVTPQDLFADLVLKLKLSNEELYNILVDFSRLLQNKLDMGANDNKFEVCLCMQKIYNSCEDSSEHATCRQILKFLFESNGFSVSFLSDENHCSNIKITW